MRNSFLRARATACLPSDARLRVDRGDALYLLNCPDGAQALADQGFELRPRGTLIEVWPTRALWPLLSAAYGEAGAEDRLCAQWSQWTDRSPDALELTLLVDALKLLEPGGGGDDALFEKKLRKTAAVCQRKGAGGLLALCRKIQLFAKEDTK